MRNYILKRRCSKLLQVLQAIVLFEMLNYTEAATQKCS